MLRKAWAWTTVLAVLLAGVTNAHAHVHVCLDGQAAPVALHFADVGDDVHEHAAGTSAVDHSGHDDVDVDVLRTALAKTFKYEQAALAPGFAGSARAAAPTTERATPARMAAPPTAPPHLRPPLRGPPAPQHS